MVFCITVKQGYHNLFNIFCFFFQYIYFFWQWKTKQHQCPIYECHRISNTNTNFKFKFKSVFEYKCTLAINTSKNNTVQQNHMFYVRQDFTVFLNCHKSLNVMSEQFKVHILWVSGRRNIQGQQGIMNLLACLQHFINLLRIYKLIANNSLQTLLMQKYTTFMR